jgi:DNA-binding beta-propeller fold protein YncE
MKIYRFVMSLLALSPALILAQGNPQVVLNAGQPVAIDGLPDAGYFVLTLGSVVFHYVPVRGELQFKDRFQNSRFGESFDLTYAVANGKESVLISSFSNETHRGYLNRYSPDGQLIHSWMIRKMPVGIDYDPASGYAYYSTADTNEIYRLRIEGGEPEYLCEIAGAQRLGSVAVDSVGHILYVADSSRGTISRIDPNSNKVSELTSGLLQPSALRYDKDRKILYIADALAHRVVALMPGQSSSKRPVGPVSESFRNPSGLAPGWNGALLISDFKTGSIYQTTPVVSHSKSK